MWRDVAAVLALVLAFAMLAAASVLLMGTVILFSRS